MQGLDTSNTELIWEIGSWFGLDHPFLIVSAKTIIYTWVVLFIIVCISISAYLILRTNGNSIAKQIVISSVSFFLDLVQQSIDTFSFMHFSFITSLFIFIFLCNAISIFPWLEEPTQDLNTTLALGIISFVYIQLVTIKYQGLWPYIKSYFSPIFIMLPLNIIGKLASIVSISFRLFGNIFGGSIITNIYFGAIKGSIFFETLGIISGLNFIIIGFFVLFEGFLQAFVFSMLSLTYLSMAIQDEGGH